MSVWRADMARGREGSANACQSQWNCLGISTVPHPSLFPSPIGIMRIISVRYKTRRTKASASLCGQRAMVVPSYSVRRSMQAWLE